MGNTVNIGIGIPSPDMWHARFGTCLAALTAYFGMHRLKNVSEQRLQIMNHRGSMLSQQRDNLILAAQNAKCTHLLMLDADMTFPRDTLHRLFARGRDIVSTNCVIKKLPASPTASLPTGELLYTDEESSGLVEVGRVGFAVALAKMHVFSKLSRPWHKNEWIPEVNHFCGEDVYLCDKMRAAGFKVYIDQDLSKEVGHIGSLIYTHDFVGSVVSYEDKNDLESQGARHAKGF